MTRGVIGGVLIGIWLGCVTVAAVQLPPEVLVDKNLLQAQLLREEEDHKGALEAMDRIVALQKEHDLNLPEEFPFHYAQTALAAGLVQAAIDAANRFLSSTGREGKYYREAVELLVRAERQLPDPSVNQALSGQTKPQGKAKPGEVSASPRETDGRTEAPQVRGCENWNTEKFFEFKGFRFNSLNVGQLNTCLAAGADPNARDNNGRTPLHWTAYLARTTLVKALLTAGADPTARDNQDRTPLHVAGKNHMRWGSYLGVVSALLTAGADPTARDNQDRTPLHHGVTLSLEDDQKEVPKAIKKLLAAGANPAARDNYGKTPLHYAAAETYGTNTRRIATTLLAAGADLEARDNSGRTPLHYAAGEGVDVEELLAFGPKIEARDKDGLTPLHHATARSYFVKSNVKSLLNAGANLETRDFSGRTPLDIANKSNATKVAKALAAAKNRRKHRPAGDPGLAALVAGVTGAAIGAAGGLDASTATELGAAIGGSVLAGEDRGNTGGSVSSAPIGAGGSSSEFDTALRNLENSCGESYRSGFSEQNHGRFYCLDAFARHCALKKGHNQQQLDALRHDFEALRSQGLESGCPYFGVFGVTYEPGIERKAINRAEKEARKARQERQRRLEEQARQAAQQSKRLIEENNARVLASDCDCISKEENSDKLTCLDGFVGLTESHCNVRFRRR